MNVHQRRREQKTESIRRAALDLFNKYGIKKVSMDEIASAAGVSKVTIYKYFKSRENLTRDIIRAVFSETISSVREIVEGDNSFLEKMRYIVSLKKSSSSLVEGEYVKGIIAGDPEMRDYINTHFQTQITELMFSFFDQGRSEGYIDRNVPNEVIYLYIEIFKAGLSARPDLLQKIASDRELSDKFTDLYFFGLLTKKNEHTD